MKSFLILAGVLLLSPFAQADEIHLSSGKILHGTLVPAGEHFVVQLDGGGTVMVKRDDVLIMGIPPSQDGRPHAVRRGRHGRRHGGRFIHSQRSGNHESQTLSSFLY